MIVSNKDREDREKRMSELVLQNLQAIERNLTFRLCDEDDIEEIFQVIESNRSTERSEESYYDQFSSQKVEIIINIRCDLLYLL